MEVVSSSTIALGVGDAGCLGLTELSDLALGHRPIQ